MVINKEKILKMKQECENQKSCNGCESIDLCKIMPARLGDMRLRPMYWGDLIIDTIVELNEDEVKVDENY